MHQALCQIKSGSMSRAISSTITFQSGPQMAMVISRYIELYQKKYGQIQYVIDFPNQVLQH